MIRNSFQLGPLGIPKGNIGGFAAIPLLSVVSVVIHNMLEIIFHHDATVFIFF